MHRLRLLLLLTVAAAILTLLGARPGLALVSLDRVQHHLVGVVLAVRHVALAPVVAHSVRKDVTARIEGRGRDASSHGRVALKSVLSVLIPEVECAIATGRAECSVLRVEGDVVDRVDLRDVALRRVAVALEREVGTALYSLAIIFRNKTCEIRWNM